MTVDEIKRQFLVPEVAAKEGLEVNRAGFCPCIFHKERTASMKLYPTSWHSYCCGQHGDVIDLVRRLHGLSFKDACRHITGEAVSSGTRRSIAISKMRREYAAKEREKKKAYLRYIGEMISFWRRRAELELDFLGAESDEYAEAIHHYVTYCGIQDYLLWD